MLMQKIPWWHTEIGEKEEARLLDAFKNKAFSLGRYVQEFEAIMAKKLKVPYCVMTNSGTSALIMSLLAIDIKPGDEVIVPALTWIATAQAVAMLGAKVILVDCLPDVPVIDTAAVRSKITNKTKAIIPVHINGRACDLESLKNITKDSGIYLIEDTCKAMFSKHDDQYLGTFGDLGCFSLGMISLVSVGYGGFVVTKNKEMYDSLLLIRDHGVVRQPEEYLYLGGNFKISDLLAAIGIAQLNRLEEKLTNVDMIYSRYAQELASLKSVNLLSVGAGEVPLYTEVYSKYREKIISFLKDHNIETSSFHLPLQRASYLNNESDFPYASRFSKTGFILPSGPSQPIEHIEKCIKVLLEYEKSVNIRMVHGK